MANVKNIIIGVSAFGLGALSGYLVTKKLLREKYKDDVYELRAFYRQKLADLGVMDTGFEAKPMGSEFDEDEEDENEDQIGGSIHKNYPGKGRQLVNYNKPPMNTILHKELDEVVKIAEEEEYVPSDDPEYEAELEQKAEEYARRRTENMQNGEPYLIDSDEFHDGPEDYEQQVLYYYAEDRVLCEDNDSVVEDEEACIGLDYEEVLDMQTTCWVRNDRLAVLYEIHRVSDSYKRAVLGAVETPREREYRIQGRRKAAMDE